HSISALVKLAADQGYEMTALRVGTGALAKLPLPAVLHIKEGASGDKGHYWVLDKIQGSQVELFDPQSTRRFHQTVDELAVQWSGNVLVFSKGGQLPGRKLDVSEMEAAIGGCCGAPPPPGILGSDKPNMRPGSGPQMCPIPHSKGAPVWSVNMMNMNFY